MAWSTAKVSVTGTGDQQVVAAQAGKQIKLIGWSLTIDGAVNLKWRSNTTDLSGLFKFAGAGMWESMHPHQSKMATTAGEALKLNLSGTGVAVTGEAFYVVE